MRHYSPISVMVPSTTPCVKMLITINVACWFFLVLVLQQYIFSSPIIYQIFGFVPARIEGQFFIWQFFTYMFIHSAGIFHLLFNMMVLWMFGSELEQLWRKKFFLIYYLVCGVGSAIVYFLCVKLYLLFGGTASVSNIPVVGASGAVFGLLLAYGWIFGERLVLFMFFVPMRARTFTILIAAVELLTVLNSGLGGPIANLAHLGGLLSGFLFLYFRRFFQESHMDRGSFYSRLKQMCYTVLRRFKKNRLKVLSNGKDISSSNYN